MNDFKHDQLHFVEDLHHSDDGDLSLTLQSSISAQVRRDLRPSHMNVALNLVGLHFISSLVTLSICPQFGVRLLGQGHGLMAYFMPLGMIGCFTLCGLFYLLVTAALTKFSFSRAQWRVLKNSYVFYMAGLSLSSMLLFSLIQGLFVLHLSIAWMVGAILGAYVMKWTPWPHRQDLSII